MSPDTARISEIIDRARISPYQILILTLCFLIALLDGFDTAIIGYIAPALREEWGLHPAQLSRLRRGCSACCSAACCSGRSPTPSAANVLLVAVLVFGGCTPGFGLYAIDRIPDLAALHHRHWPRGRDTDLHYSQLGYSPARRRMLMVTLSWSGFTAGLALGGLLAGQIIPAFGWRGVLLVGGIAPLALLPLLAWQMPESVRFMAANAKHADRLRRVVERITGRRWTGHHRR